MVARCATSMSRCCNMHRQGQGQGQGHGHIIPYLATHKHQHKYEHKHAYTLLWRAVRVSDIYAYCVMPEARPHSADSSRQQVCGVRTWCLCDEQRGTALELELISVQSCLFLLSPLTSGTRGRRSCFVLCARITASAGIIEFARRLVWRAGSNQWRTVQVVAACRCDSRRGCHPHDMHADPEM